MEIELLVKKEQLDNSQRNFVVLLEGFHYDPETLRLSGRSDQPQKLEGLIYSYKDHDQIWENHRPVSEQAGQYAGRLTQINPSRNGRGLCRLCSIANKF